MLRVVLDAIHRAESTAARVQAAADGLHDLGFDRVVLSLRDASLNPTFVAKAGCPEVSSPTGAGLAPLPGAVWRRRLPHIERYRQGDLYLLDGSDEWVAREFFGCDPVARGAGDSWLATDLILGVLRGARQEVLGIAKIAGPRDGKRPSAALLRDVDELLRLLGSRVSFDALEALARQRSERLQLLQDAGASLTRSLDEQEIMRELARQVQRAVRCDGVAVLIPDLHTDTLTTALRVVRGMERTRAAVRLGEGIVAEVARTGQPVRIGDREADRQRERAGKALPLSTYDVVGESGSARSVLAVPMRVGIRLVGVLAVHSTLVDVYADDDQEVLATMASQAATAIANARRYAESERERRTTEALADVARAVGESLRLGEVLRLILRHSISLLGVEGACIALRTGDYLHVVAAMGTADVLSGLHLPIGASLAGRAVQTNDLVLVNEITPEVPLSRVAASLARIQRTMVAPLGTGHGTIGALSVINRERPFNQEDTKVLQRLADQVAVAIVNARLFEEVERATREWKLAFDSTASGLVVLEESLTVSRCNSRAAELCGCTIAGLLGRRFRDALVGSAEAAEGQHIDGLIAGALREGQPVRGTVRVSASGRLFTIVAAPHPDGGCVITFDDVSEASRLAEQHRAVLDTVSDAIVIVGRTGRISFANPAARTLLQRHDLEGLPAARVVPKEWNKTVRRHEVLVRSGKAQQYECEVVCADGSRRMVEVGSTPLIELGEITGSVACLRDVTRQRQDAMARERSESLYTRLVESATDAIFTVDLQGRFTSVNPAFLNEAGLTRSQVLGQQYLALVDPVDRREAELAMAATLSGERRRSQLRCIGARGSRLTMVTCAPIHERGQVVGALGIVRDITNDEVEREARGQQARLAAIGQSLARVANELNNPLTSLLALAELHVDSTTLTVEDRRALAQIVDEARRASRIVNQLLDGTSDVRESSDQPGRIPLNAVLRRALDLQGYSLRTARVRVVTDLTEHPLEVDGDPLQLQQVFSNLITNAEQALAEYPGERELRVHSRVEGAHAVVEVIDSGPGITARDLPRVLEPMFTTRSGRGHRGLGLTIANTIIREHGGRLEVRSNHEEGVRCTVRLPVPSGPEPSPRIPTPVSLAAASPARSVLLIEDEPTLRSTISRFLRGQGYVVDLAANGAAALELLARHRYDVILLDLRMSGMTGEAVYETIESAYPDQAAQVLFMTGDLHSEAALRFIRRTGRPMLAKPFALADLLAGVTEVMT